jgi:hypothetical protein
VGTNPQGCALQLPFGICLLSNAQVQDLENILIIGVGGFILLVGGLIIVISALGSTKVGGKAKTVAKAANLPAAAVRGTVRGTVSQGGAAVGRVQTRQANRDMARNRESLARERAQQKSQPPRRIENPLGTRQANRARMERRQRQREVPKYNYDEIPF